MGHRYIVIQGAHVDVVYGKWPGEAGSRSRQKGCLPQPLLRRRTGAAAFGANMLLCLDSKIHSVQAVCFPDFRPKRTFLCCCNNNFRILGGSHLNCAGWLWVEGRGEYSHDGGCGWLAPGDACTYVLASPAARAPPGDAPGHLHKQTGAAWSRLQCVHCHPSPAASAAGGWGGPGPVRGCPRVLGRLQPHPGRPGRPANHPNNRPTGKRAKNAVDILHVVRK